jgi:hypothetical protein
MLTGIGYLHVAGSNAIAARLVVDDRAAEATDKPLTACVGILWPSLHI